MSLDALDYLAAGGAAVVAGAVNALAGGGTLVSFPTLIGLGVAPVPANITNTVSLFPGYASGTWAQRDDLRPQLAWGRTLAIVSGAGGLGGSVLLLAVPAHAFRVAIPYLILLSCVLLFFQDRIRDLIPLPEESEAGDRPPRQSPLLLPLIFVASVYGGFFGAGLGIVLLALLGLFSPEPLTKLNALKQGLSSVINVVAAVLFAASGRVIWSLVVVMAIGALLGGFAGGRFVTVIDSVLLRRLVVIAGVAVAIAFWVG